MDIIREENGPLEAVIQINVTEEDYREQVDKELKNVQKKAQMPGFRPGKVPVGLVKKMYGQQVLAEEVNKILADSLYNYIKENELNVLGNPVPDQEKADAIDWETQKEFELHYHVGLAPEINLELSDEIQVDYHKIIVDSDIADNYIKDIRKRYGKMTNPGTAADEDVLFGEFVEMNDESTPREEGHTHKANVYIQYLKDEELKKQLTGAKPGASFVMDVNKSVGSEAEAAAMLGVKKEEIGNYNPLFRFTIESISRVDPADLDEELFKKVAPDKELKTEEEFRDFVAEQIGQQYQTDADKHFKNLVMEQILQLTKLPLPESFLKKWLLDTNKEELTSEKIDNEFDQFADSFRWQLIENHLIKTHNLEVAPEEVNKHIEGFIKAQLKQYGQDNVEQSVLDEYVKNVAANKDEVKKIYDHLFDQKILELFKEKLKLNEIQINFDDFVKLVTEKYKQDKGATATETDTKTE